MTKLEAIVDQASRLSPIEREELLRILSAHTFGNGTADEVAVGQRGFAAWTESTEGEDWSMFYPGTLPNGGQPRQ